MFDGLFKNKFYNKCKTALKVLNMRIEIIKKKRKAMQKFLTSDIADLLRSGLDMIAFGRVEGLLIEMNTSSCYDLVEQFCLHICNNLVDMSKQKECPEDCREAAASLMYAAARFADLPELRELRTIFAERYGNSLDYFVSKEFVEKLKSTKPTNDMKLQMMQDIATEAGVGWNLEATQERLFKPPVARQNSRNNDVKQARRIENDALKDYNAHHFSYNPEGRTPFKDIQIDHTVRTGQELEPDTANMQPEAFHKRKPSFYGLIPPPYTKSKLGQTRNEDEIQEPPVSESSTGRNEIRHPNGADGESKPKPTSMGRHRWKPTRDRDENDMRDEEERMLDRLLRFYSKKKSATQRTNESESAVREASTQEASINRRRPTRVRSWDMPPSSLQDEPSSDGPSNTKRGHTRAASFQPETGPVHPKLPDYDDFVARLASLREGN